MQMWANATKAARLPGTGRGSVSMAGLLKSFMLKNYRA
ncbi:hypothetical protein ALP26_103806 [Pseudomonas savastanoi pv. glycinea]|uniref:Uncharacterized protein n=1 Tax=Pseudomonas savastanoi pv. glycinea TaxID=318 RepID=A0A0P9S7S0_PSESG|nr:Unknown protein sequence [Pseudomonas savastanoi pv. glycinea]KPC45345.1 Unknown protein sequence [Pseudomonas savastanoi pv. glycinea]KPX37977.1 hypothetical protein ALO37_102958 [Pseudomonas savastanoi pv. glycinea]RMM56967.1 hypothetical protein ALQ75_103717 [Pseudomonas savastanoi pv. glycinea]RMM93828.1 hypothetical protein ALQ70_103123 [Pseudomonas savastanoi pv. glycinea]